jgi:hypothetical protein
MSIRWSKTTSYTDLWEATGEKSVTLQSRKRKWRSMGHALRKEDKSIENKALDWNLQGARRRGRSGQTWKRTILEEAGKCSKTWSEIKSLAST